MMDVTTEKSKFHMIKNDVTTEKSKFHMIKKVPILHDRGL